MILLDNNTTRVAVTSEESLHNGIESILEHCGNHTGPIHVIVELSTKTPAQTEHKPDSSNEDNNISKRNPEETEKSNKPVKLSDPIKWSNLSEESVQLTIQTLRSMGYEQKKSYLRKLIHIAQGHLGQIVDFLQVYPNGIEKVKPAS